MAVSLPRGALIAGAVVVLAALDLFVALRGDGEPLSPDAMHAALETAKKVQKTGDLIVHSPLFRMSELKELGDLPSTPSLPLENLRKTRRIVVIDRTDHRIYGLDDPKEVL